MRINKFLGLFVLILSPFLVHSQFKKYTNEFLNIGAGARGLAMGSAQVASAKDATAGYWNPAGLVGVKDVPNLGIMHAEYFSGIAKYDYATIALPVNNNKRTIGFSLLRFAVDEIPNTLYLIEANGAIDYSKITTFSVADYAFLFSFAQNIKQTEKKQISFGANAKVIYRKIGSFATAWGFGLDAGLQMHGKNWNLGVMARDITTTFNAWSFKFSDAEKEKLYLANNDIPVKSTEITLPRLVLGGGYNFKLGKSLNLMAEANINVTFDGQRNTVLSTTTASADPTLGLELAIKDAFFIRGGISNFQKSIDDTDSMNIKKVWIYQPSIGAGFKIKNLMLDYAFTNLANQSSPLYTHIFSLRMNLVKKEKQNN